MGLAWNFNEIMNCWFEFEAVISDIDGISVKVKVTAGC
jgi:hypothetical protein